MEKAAGYRELEHTADWQLEVWAPDLESLLVQAVHGMYALSGVRFKKDETRMERSLSIHAEDAESLLVRFLGELRYFCFEENVAFDAFDLRLEGNSLQANLSGFPVASVDKEIKAVTYHDLAIKKTARGLEARIVFDV